MCALLAVGALAGYLVRGPGHSARSEAAAAHSANAALAARLRRERARFRRALRAARAAVDSSSAYAAAQRREILAAQGGRSAIGFCSSRDFPTVDVKVLAPTAGSTVASPVLAHLVVDKPLGCNAEYYVTVDGALYAPVHHFTRLSVNGPRHPDVARAVPGRPRVPPPGAC